MDSRGFTLIELLIVIAIIAILALIAVPNFLEAQVRAKVARTRADLRSICAALEAYCADNASYPPPKTNQGWFFARARLTTPVAYISGGPVFADPFGAPMSENLETGSIVYQKLPACYRYYTFDKTGNNTNTNADVYAFYVLAGNGPDRTRYPHVGARLSQSDLDASDFKDILDQIYDPTNGTVSVGEVLRFGACAPTRAQRIAGICARGGW